MTPQQVARVLKVARDELRVKGKPVSDVERALVAAIKECEAIGAEEAVVLDQRSDPYTGEQHCPGCGFSAEFTFQAGLCPPGFHKPPVNPDGGLYASDGMGHEAGSLPVAVKQPSDHGTYRVCVYFGDRETDADAFKRWVNNGNWDGFYSYLLAQNPVVRFPPDVTQPQPAVRVTEPLRVPKAPGNPDDTTPLNMLDPAAVYHEFIPGSEWQGAFCRVCDKTRFDDVHQLAPGEVTLPGGGVKPGKKLDPGDKF